MSASVSTSASAEVRALAEIEKRGGWTNVTGIAFSYGYVKIRFVNDDDNVVLSTNCGAGQYACGKFLSDTNRVSDFRLVAGREAYVCARMRDADSLRVVAADERDALGFKRYTFVLTWKHAWPDIVEGPFEMAAAAEAVRAGWETYLNRPPIEDTLRRYQELREARDRRMAEAKAAAVAAAFSPFTTFIRRLQDAYDGCGGDGSSGVELKTD